MNNEDLKFLRNLFDDKRDDELKAHFGDLFGSVRMGDDQTNEKRENEMATVNEAITELRKLKQKRTFGDDNKKNGFEVRKVCRNISKGARKHAELETSANQVDSVICLLEEYIMLSEIWWKHNPRIGGRDEHANNLAEAVAYIFKEMDEPIKAGTYNNGGTGETVPSTKFGKVVRWAFERHGISSSWISPHRSVANGYRRKKAD